MTGPLSAREAVERILRDIQRQPPLRIPLDDAAGSVLAERVISPIDIPAHTNSAMDGYAVRADDVRGASAASPKCLDVIEQIPAGSFPTKTIGPRQCARIFTGAPLPLGADSVIRQEDTDLGAERVIVVTDRDAGSNLRFAGEDIKAGAIVFEPGLELSASHLGVLASLAIAHPVV
ncbi:MAG: molybdopterin molybdenumtransferase MoeA, partial [Gemmatimonadota bacterium]